MHSPFRKSIHHKLHKNLRNTLIKARHDLGLTQRELAEKIGVTYSVIGKIETGDRRLDAIEFYEYTKVLGLIPSETLFLLFHEYDKYEAGGGNPNARSLSAFLVIVTARFWLFICVLGYIPNFTKNYCFHHLVDYLSKEKSYERDLLLTAFSKRLQQAVNESSFAKQEQGVLSAQLGVSRQALRKWLKGKALPSQTRLPTIADLLKIDLAWLATGQGEMHNINAKVFNTSSLQQVPFSLNVNEVNLLKNYRKLSTETQKLFSDLFSNLTVIKS